MQFAIYAQISILILVFLAGIFGNANIVIATVASRQLQQRSALLIGILAAIDLVVYSADLEDLHQK